jgi:hypothetical protein
VEEEIAERADGLVAQGGGHDEGAPLMAVPAGAVTMLRTWHVLQPIWLNRMSPCWASNVAARAVSREGALVARMKRAKACTSAPSSSGSITVSNAATEFPLEVFSVG